MKFIFTGTLYRFVDFSKEVEVTVTGTIRDCLQGLFSLYPTIESKLLDNQGNISKTHRVFLNGEQLVSPSAQDNAHLMDAVIGENDEIYIVTAITGG